LQDGRQRKVKIVFRPAAAAAAAWSSLASENGLGSDRSAAGG